MAEATDAAPGVVASIPVVGDPAAHAAAAKESTDALAAQAETVTDSDEITSLDGDSPAAPAEGQAQESAPEEAAPEPETEPETQAAEEGDPEQAAAEEEGEGEAEGEGEEAAGDTLVFDFGGNKLEVPKDSVPPELAEKIDTFSKDIWKDYSRKSQANAEVAKSNKLRGDTLEKMAGLNGAALQTYSTGLLLRTEIAQLQQIARPTAAEMDDLHRTDPDRYRRVSDQYADIDRQISTKQAQFQDVVARVGQQEAELDGAHQAELERRSTAGRTVLDKRIPDFSTKHAPKVVAYAVERGMTVVEANAWALNPMLTEMGYKAMLYDRMQAAAAKAANGSPRAQASAAPALKAKGAASDTPSDPDKMSMTKLASHLGLPG
tara:strand:- start:3363 stop:4493 length:1131 start_codon:yes stop_codon:yes gene_type:complete